MRSILNHGVSKYECAIVYVNNLVAIINKPSWIKVAREFKFSFSSKFSLAIRLMLFVIP